MDVLATTGQGGGYGFCSGLWSPGLPNVIFPALKVSTTNRSIRTFLVDGKASYQEVSAEAHYRWQTRLSVQVGGYFCLIDTQTPDVRLTNVDTRGRYAGFRFHLSERW